MYDAKAYMKEYREKNKAKLEQQRQAYYQKHREKLIEEAKIRTKEYRLLHPERRKIEGKKYRQVHANDIKDYRKRNREHIIAYLKEYYSQNKEPLLVKQKLYYQKNFDRISQQMHEYRLKNRDNIRKNAAIYMKNRINLDENFALQQRLRNLVRNMLKTEEPGKTGNSKYGIDYAAIANHLGVPPDDGRKYQIDHVKPLCAFDLRDPEQIKQAFSPENHQWLTPEENALKAKKEKELYGKRGKTKWS